MLVSPKEKEAWQKAKAEQKRCGRCTWWHIHEMAFYCPDCDAEIIERYYLLLKKKPK